MHKEIYDKLKAVAKAGQVTHYSEVAPLAGLDMSLQEDRNIIATILDEISTFEHNQGNPLLSAVVIHKHDNIPGQGFFTLAKRLGLQKRKDNFLFFIQELRRVHDYWAVESKKEDLGTSYAKSGTLVREERDAGKKIN